MMLTTLCICMLTWHRTQALGKQWRLDRSPRCHAPPSSFESCAFF